ncbi:MAG: hypothetical protein SGPRY_014011, partial [Prymnesium sp.]
CTYGQTELAGPVMWGEPGGDPNLLRPFPGVDFELVGDSEEQNEGELVLLNNESSTVRTGEEIGEDRDSLVVLPFLTS